MQASPSPTSAVPLSALREVLSEEMGTAHWTVDLPGIEDRALLQPAGTRVSYQLKLDRVMHLTGRIALLPSDWRDGTGSLQAHVEISRPDSSNQRIWTGTLAPARTHGDPHGTALICEIPADTTQLTLTTSRHTVTDGQSIIQLLWITPELSDPYAAPSPPPPATLPAPTDTGPLISVLCPVHDPPLEMLEQCIASVQNQTYRNWELCLVDDGSRDSAIITRLKDYAHGDPRVHLRRNDTPGGISHATNTALDLATGDYVALLDHDDTIETTALAKVAQTILADPTLDMIYTDEAVIPMLEPPIANLKPGWSPDHLRALMYTCHLGVYRRSLTEKLGGFLTTYDGCQDYDFVLRLSEVTDRVAHIPEILYRWRAHTASTAGSDQAKPYAYVAQVRAIDAHLRRLGDVQGEVAHGYQPGIHVISHGVDPAAGVEVILPSSDPAGLASTITSLTAQPHPSWHLTIATPAAEHPDPHTLTELGLTPDRVTLLDTDGSTAQRLNTAANASHADHLLLTTTPFSALTHNWLTRLIGYSHQPGIAAAGPILLNPNGHVLHAGIALPHGIPLYLLYGMDAAASMQAAVNLTALDGLLMTSRGALGELGGLSPDTGELVLIDYCVRARREDLRMVVVPDARVTVDASAPLNDIAGMLSLRRAWWVRRQRDIYYTSAFRQDRGDRKPALST